ncbi:esterase [Azorhizobium oxalatiphilum]|uniref:Esterase n=1 Tax=Azorhizobium oxalatiphilum TaxID=980631 RepID=A0A917C5S4_9HYPH|nr:alpha/beta hydrolase-fold protein [Azorhizobium oxalatiphilum]GGF70377.1 esterase [Azorhizobium oxalatiphilum]
MSIENEKNAPMPGTVQFDIVPRAGGPAWRIFLRIPTSEMPKDGWPTLYMLDGNAVIGTAVDAVRVQAAYPLATGVREAALIAIGYPTDDAYDGVRRSWDLGPPPGASYPPFTPDGPEVKTGGADAFLAFIEEELKPEIARRLTVDPKRQAIFGHSFGGLFVLHMLFNRPDAFANWIAISPAIWWEDAVVKKGMAGFAANPRPARVLLAAAEYEQTLAPFQEHQSDREARLARLTVSRGLDDTHEMAAWLAALPGVHAECVVFEGETHMSVLPVAVNRTVRFAFGPDAP